MCRDVEPWVDLILDGRKTWEIRGTKTGVRGRIALIRKGSGKVVGTCDLVDVVGPLSRHELAAAVGSHCIDLNKINRLISYSTPYAWVLRKPVKLPVPINYRHPSGAVIWVRLDQETDERIARAAS